ncbi:nuclear transport factor 2 family protein [Oecophyllibacter saccharovorans]|uniref:Nuclear transport factor 2 family protein n=1 Tax=Oecophyllibacter saccharovorans TaxID=2558360 RepID=A0A506UL12_9PROT|nr:nuclear transport factor 2 family protein [Oecophyllibacter saccharovorans]TPW33932.1 nuclear transport factor 2 family protein [Oecophyllibacter saccharovorans]
MMTDTARKTVENWYATGNTDLLANDILWEVLPTFPEGGRYEGRKAVVGTFVPKVMTHFSEYEAHPHSFMVDGNVVATTGVYHVRTKKDPSGEGRAGDITFAHFWTVKNGKIAALYQVADTATAQTLLQTGEQAA